MALFGRPRLYKQIQAWTKNNNSNNISSDKYRNDKSQLNYFVQANSESGRNTGCL